MDFVKCLENVKKLYKIYNENKDFFCVDCNKLLTDYEYIFIGNNISGTQYDVARVKWGGSWRMPTLAECKELINKCTWTWTTYNGVEGQKVTGPNGNSIFLPFAGYRYGAGVSSQGSYGGYWSGTLDEGGSYYAYYLYFSNGNVYWHNYFRYYGHSVRPVSE